MTPKLEFNCPENWENMKVGLLSRHCENCNKEVHDFTAMTKENIILFLLRNKDKKICGRILPSQLDYSREEVLITIESLLQKNRKANFAFYLLTIGSLTLLSCSNDKKGYSSTSTFDSLIQIDSVSDSSTIPEPDYKYVQQDALSKVLDSQPEALLGMVLTSEDADDTNESVYFVDVMPEFAGGLDSLTAYLKSNVKYPHWEKRNKIEGTIYVSFVVDTTGRIKNAKIAGTVERSKNFNDEVLRVMTSMPRWIPGSQVGRKVDVKMTLPIKFKL